MVFPFEQPQSALGLLRGVTTMLDNIDTKAVSNFLSTTAIDIGIKILAAIVFWIVGRWLIRMVTRLMQSAMNRSNVDSTLTRYLGSIVSVMLNIVLVIGILGYFGIQTTSFA